ncbi:RNA polymerase sigma factor [Intrasporangium sp. YIM S08009]|uniref:RNA polymerase sigma factor n=1 Tax=Intrasporangium zincisolvens TaxID=3080018 RepID=UPI002B054767|nr:sigma-70 family RNA polymerase sigma factor [Intrasporangium sp. YIM S08009]
MGWSAPGASPEPQRREASISAIDRTTDRPGEPGGPDDGAVDDAVALARVRAGDPAAYAVLVVRHAPMARRLAVLSGAGDDADDVVQEAFVKAYAALPRFRAGAGFRPWLLRIVVNETRNTVRGRSRRLLRELRVAVREVAEGGRGDRTDPADAAVGADRRAGLLEALDALPTELREVVTCRYLLELSEAETATVLDLPAGTVKSRLHRALATLREVLADA